MNPTYPQAGTETDQENELRALDRAFDRIVAKGRQLAALLALMTITAVDDEVVPMHRLAACQLAYQLTEEMISAAMAAIAAIS
jgi:hypothetical protein